MNPVRVKGLHMRPPLANYMTPVTPPGDKGYKQVLQLHLGLHLHNTTLWLQTRVTNKDYNYQDNFLKLTDLVLIGGPDDGVITPWQSR